MKVYFLDSDNINDVKIKIDDLYSKSINTFYKKRHELNEGTKSISTYLLIIEVDCIIDQLNDENFKSFYFEWLIELLEKIRNDTVKYHSNTCIIRAIFDILFKYCFDFEYKIPYLCCNNKRFKKLQFEILRDLRWKIRKESI